MTALVVVRALGMCTVQDRGRPGRMHEALAPGGALVRGALAAATRQVGNADSDAAVEVLGVLVVRATRDLVVATERLPARLLAAGEELVVDSAPSRAAYLAVRGGIAEPRVLGSRATQRSAGIGRILRAGDELVVGAASTRASAAAPAAPFTHDAAAPIVIVPGPDREAFPRGALARLLRGSYRIAPTSDRVGTRLEGHALQRASTREQTAPLVVGALEVPPDGQPIVLGPEHPTTGGYPVIAVVASPSLDAFFARPLGGTVEFTLP